MKTGKNMRITELLEGKKFNDLDFIKQEGDKKELDYDLSEDLSFFMHNDDDTYRRHTYPAIAGCIDRVKANKDTNAELFKKAVEESYKEYISNFPIRHLPDQLDEKMCKEICDKLHEEFCDHYSEGKYKD